MRDLTGHDAMTIHRALGYSPKEDRFLRDEDDPLSNDVELVIVDEASMLSLELADALFRAAGDCHVLLVGDTDQLPPIGPGRVLADLVASAVVPRVHLTAIYRQAARSLIVRSARRINRGEAPYLSLEEAKAELGGEELDEDFFFVSRSGPETLREAVLELVCEALPRPRLRPAHRGDDARADAARPGRARRAERRARGAAQSRRAAASSSRARACASARGSSRRATTTRPTAR